MIDHSKQIVLVRKTMDGFPFPWFIAGGWALEIAAGKQHREHEDVDICIFRENADSILAHFADWDLKVSIPGEHRLIPCKSVEDTLSPRFGLHLHKDSDFIEILLTDKKGDHVVFRRDPSITISYSQFARFDADGLPYVAPEWQLLFKAKEPRQKDEEDFLTHAPHLDTSGKRWLLSALTKHLPHSEWILKLQKLL